MNRKGKEGEKMSDGKGRDGTGKEAESRRN